jgi:hypothetical protein
LQQQTYPILPDDTLEMTQIRQNQTLWHPWRSNQRVQIGWESNSRRLGLHQSYQRHVWLTSSRIPWTWSPRNETKCRGILPKQTGIGLVETLVGNVADMSVICLLTRHFLRIWGRHLKCRDILTGFVSESCVSACLWRHIVAHKGNQV